MHTMSVADTGPSRGPPARKVPTIMAEDKPAPESQDIQQPAPVVIDADTTEASPATVADAEEDILTDALEMTVCPGCNAEIDTSEVPPFAEIACPACGAAIQTQARFGAFRLVRKLGSGGMGSVFLGQDEALNRKVAIKVVKRSLGSNPGTMEAFQREAQATARLNNPNIVQIYAFGEEKGQPYIAMEFVGGGSLDALVEDTVRMDPAFVLRVGKEIALALGAAQEAGLIHGDVKPENILFDENYRAKLVDFGIASALSADVNAKEIWGTPYYIAPEKARGKKADIRSDLYSLGATLYHALTLHPPFDGPDARAVVAARFTTPPAPIARFRPDVERKAADIVERMMHPNPMMRFPNVHALVTAIDEYLVTVTPASRSERPSAGSPSRTTGVRMQPVDPADTPAAADTPATGGKKKIVISKSRRNVPAAAPASADIPPAADGDFPIQPELAPEKPKANPVKGCLIAFFVFLALLIVGAIGGVVWFVQRNAKAQHAMEARVAAAKQIEKDADEFNARVAAAAEPIVKTDAEAEKILRDIASIVAKATEAPWNIPDLEPAEPVLPELAKPAAAAEVPEEPSAAAPAAALPMPADLLAIKDDPAFANGNAKDTRRALIKFAKEHQELAKDAALVADVVAAIRDPENAKDADMLDVAVAEALEKAVQRAEAAKAAAEAAPADSGDAPAEDAPAADVEAESAEGAEAGEEAESAEEPAPAGPHPFAVLAEKLVEPARRIRRARREAEARRDREPPTFTAIKGDTVTDAQYDERARFKNLREQDEAAVRALLVPCQDALKELRRNKESLLRKSREYLEAIRQREENAEKERREAEAQAKAQREAEARQARIQQEKDAAAEKVDGVAEFLQAYEFDRALSSLGPFRSASDVQEANEIVQHAYDRIEYLSKLRLFLLTDLHEGGGLKWGLINRDIADADPEAGTISVRGGAASEIAKAPLRIWMNLIDLLVVNRAPERQRLSMLQQGDLLYGAAIFCLEYGGGSEEATKRAVEWARKARTANETIVLKIPVLTPQLEEALQDEF